MKTLVAYYTKKGKTRAVAQHMAELLQADVFEVTEEPGFRMGELFGRLPAVAPYQGDLKSYDRVILCIPIKKERIAAPMRAFAQRYGSTMNRVVYAFVKNGLTKDYPNCITEMDALVGKTFEQAIFVDPDGPQVNVAKFVEQLQA